jgi:hypothetical protein
MSLVRNFFKPKKESFKEDKSYQLIQSFLDLKDRPDFPLTLAESNLKDILQNSSSPDEELLFIMEDSIFASLYATFYEQILMTINENAHLSMELIESFEKDYESREQIIATQTEHHLNFIINNGRCAGCPCCDNHHDVAELITYFQNNDRQFFITLFLGMQSIQYAMDHLLYNIIPSRPEIIETLTSEDILTLRKYIFNFAQTSEVGR